MKFLAAPLIALTLALSSAPAAEAKTPPEILKPYKSYRTALKAGDMKLARKQARKAWDAAESALGDTKMTGDLAANYAGILVGGKSEKAQVEAIDRAMALTTEYGEDASTMYMERGLTKIAILGRLGNNRSVGGEARKLVSFAEKNGLEASTFYAEALTVMAGHHAEKGNERKSADLSARALKVFENASDGVVSAYPLHAKLYQGYVLESDNDFMAAALSYQDVMEATDGIDPGEVQLVGETLGRWIYMRNALESEGRLEEAEQKGLCQCWPYDKARNEDVKPIKRTPPKMPRGAQQSGYVVVEFDLSDAGKPVDPRVVTAWPDYYEEPAVDAVMEWDYTPRTAEQTDEDRTDIVTTIRFVLQTSGGKTIW